MRPSSSTFLTIPEMCIRDRAGTELSFQLPSLELFLSSVPTEEILRQYDAGILKSYDFAPPYPCLLYTSFRL